MMHDMTPMRCADCYYYLVSTGECRRMPPSVTVRHHGPQLLYENRWPFMQPNDWCGMFVPTDRKEIGG